MELRRQNEARILRELDELRKQLATCSACDKGDVDISAGPVKMHGSGRWLAAIVLALTAAAFGSNGKIFTWIAGFFKQ